VDALAIPLLHVNELHKPEAAGRQLVKLLSCLPRLVKSAGRQAPERSISLPPIQRGVNGLLQHHRMDILGRHCAVHMRLQRAQAGKRAQMSPQVPQKV
jgi:hypothetical protein